MEIRLGPVFGSSAPRTPTGRRCSLSEQRYRREIEDCDRATQDSDGQGNLRESLRRELDDWTWPCRLIDNPKLAWDGLSDGEKEKLQQDPVRLREAAFLLLLAREYCGDAFQRQTTRITSSTSETVTRIIGMPVS